jgi:hypothetical protein
MQIYFSQFIKYIQRITSLRSSMLMKCLVMILSMDQLALLYLVPKWTNSQVKWCVVTFMEVIKFFFIFVFHNIYYVLFTQMCTLNCLRFDFVGKFNVIAHLIILDYYRSYIVYPHAWLHLFLNLFQ